MPGGLRKMPKVWHLSLAEAQSELRAAGLVFTLQYAPNLVVPEGDLMAVAPRPDTVLTDETGIILTISTGPPRRPDA
jgi:beta-lactam-binding protein with PASTA domain